MNDSKHLFFLMFIMIISCTQKDEFPACALCSFTCLSDLDEDVLSNDCIDNHECTFKIMSQSQMTNNLNSSILTISGNNLVFFMIDSSEGEDEIADDEFTRSLIFELDGSLQNFSVEGEALRDLNVHYRTICFCDEIDFKEVTSGCLQGEQQADGSWFIQANLEVTYQSGIQSVKLDALFQI